MEKKKPTKTAKKKPGKSETITFVYKNKFKGSEAKKEPPNLIDLLRKQWGKDYGSLTSKKGINFYLLEGFIREAIREKDEPTVWELSGDCVYALAR